jgi:hypothetical protein
MTHTVDPTVATLCDALAAPLARLRDAGNVACPSDDLAREALSGCVTKGRWRKSKPAADKPAAQVLWQLVKFHRGGGSLYGWPWFADEQQRDQLDTLAILLLGCHSRAAEAWSRALS